MRIGIDGRYIHDHFPGIGRYTYNLLLGLAQVVKDDSIVVVHNPSLPNTRYDMGVLAALPQVELAPTSAAPFSLAEQWALPRLARRLRLDVWHAPYYIAPYWLPWPLVVTMHDAISSHYPQYLPSLAARLSYEAAMRLAVRAARRIIAVSQASQADLMRFFGVTPAKISVVYEAADVGYGRQSAQTVSAMRARLGLPERYVLHLGMNKPHKNLVRLVEAWGRVCAHTPGVQLVLAGRHDARYPQAWEAVQRMGLADRIRFLGDIAAEDMPALYSGATVFVFPSLYEGFGLPVLEAMACGAAVVCSNSPALLEVAGDAALTVDPLDVEGLAEAIKRVLCDETLRRDLQERGQAQAALFSWEKAARETLQVYRAGVEQE